MCPLPDFEARLDPDALQKRLRLAGCYLAAFEVMKRTVVDHLLGFFADDYRDREPLPSDDYREHVLSLDRRAFVASTLWYERMGILSARDRDQLRTIWDHRNEVAHELVNCMLDPGRDVATDHLDDMIEYTELIGLYWMSTWRDAGLGPPPETPYPASEFLRYLYSCS